jgi:hypothetical protein
MVSGFSKSRQCNHPLFFDIRGVRVGIYSTFIAILDIYSEKAVENITIAYRYITGLSTMRSLHYHAAWDRETVTSTFGAPAVLIRGPDSVFTKRKSPDSIDRNTINGNPAHSHNLQCAI